MSLNSLPDEIIAKIAKRMPGLDRCNLMATNKRYGNIWKAYRLDYKQGIVEKIKVSFGWFNAPWELTIELTKKDGSTERFKIKKYELLSDMLSEIQLVEIFEIGGVEINSVFVKELEKNKSKFREIQYTGITKYNISEEEFGSLMSLGQKLFFDDIRFQIFLSFQTVEIRNNQHIYGYTKRELTIIENPMTEKDFLSDEILQIILPRTSELTVQEYEPYVPYCYYSDASKLTDSFLKYILPKYWPKVLKIGNCKTGFTLQGIINFIQLAHTEGEDNIIYQLGWLKVDCREDAKNIITEFAEKLDYFIDITSEVYENSDDEHDNEGPVEEAME